MNKNKNRLFFVKKDPVELRRKQKKKRKKKDRIQFIVIFFSHLNSVALRPLFFYLYSFFFFFVFFFLFSDVTFAHPTFCLAATTRQWVCKLGFIVQRWASCPYRKLYWKNGKKRISKRWRASLRARAACQCSRNQRRRLVMGSRSNPTARRAQQKRISQQRTRYVAKRSGNLHNQFLWHQPVLLAAMAMPPQTSESICFVFFFAQKACFSAPMALFCTHTDLVFRRTPTIWRKATAATVCSIGKLLWNANQTKR